ncbi:MAG TPA: GDP-mannose 4,6-dehydratase [Thermoanaerobaculia bacterium]|nr:GDP-mannose 4,6-dehydratase [Thermoanaerobaculia bacterium]
MKALITGGCGFIGSHLADACIARGDEVFVIDDLSTGRVENVHHLLGEPRFHLTIDSILQERVLDELVAACDVVFHLAAAVGVRLIVESPVRTIETNIRGTEVVLAAAARHGKRVLIASTSEVYGLSEQIPFREDANIVMGAPTKGRWSYACSKAIDEFLAIAYHREKKLPVVIVRMFNTVGPRQTSRYGMVVPALVEQALEEKPLTVFGSGEQTRCFSWIGEVVESLLQLVEHPSADGEVFNVGSTEEVSITQLAERILALTGSRSPIVYVPYAEAYEPGFEDMPRRVPDPSKLERYIGIRPRASLETILRAIIAERREVPARAAAAPQGRTAFLAGETASRNS